MKILVDTSVWVRALLGREPYTGQLRRLLLNNSAIGHDLVFGELLIGDKGGRPRVLAEYAKIERCPTVPHDDAVALVQQGRLHGLGLSWIDVHLLASALVGRHKLWTADAALESAAARYGADWKSK